MTGNKTETYYLGLTIGPIVKTLMTAQKTRPLWAASYTFAYLMKEIAHAFYKKDKSRTWYKPALGDVALETFKKPDKRSILALKETGAGIFPDHLILQSTSQQDVGELKKIAKKVIENYAGNIATAIGKANESGVIKKYFLKYFQVYIVRKALDAKANPILEMSKLLSTLELQQGFAPVKEDYLTDFFGLTPKSDKDRSFLIEDAFLDGDNIKSIPEIALTTHLSNLEIRIGKDHIKAFVAKQFAEAKVNALLNKSVKSVEEVPDQYIAWVKEFITKYNKENKANPYPAPFYTGQKYIAIVQADGDSIGKLLEVLPLASLLDFSKKLTLFAVEAAELVKTYNGLPVYFGGDDALFFAPVIDDEKNIFMLLRAMNKKFKKYFKDFSKTQQSPTLSFGLSITYAKYPMYEALAHSDFLLRKAAKEGLESDETDKTTGEKKRLKNNIAFRVLKHSGSSFGGLIHLDAQKDFSILKAFLKVFEMNAESGNEALRSITYRLVENKQLFELIGKNKPALKNFLKNAFDEAVHKEHKKYLSKVAKLVHHCYEHWHRYPQEVDEDTFKSPNRLAYNLLKTIAFLTTTEE